MGLQYLTLKCIARVFSLKSSLEKLLTISWVMWAYIVLVKVWERVHLKSLDSEFRGSLTTWLELWSDTLNPTWHETIQIPTCTFHMAFYRLSLVNQSRANCEFTFFIGLHKTLTLDPYIKFHKKYKEMIEQNYNQIWHEIRANIKHSCKSQLYKKKIIKKK